MDAVTLTRWFKSIPGHIFKISFFVRMTFIISLNYTSVKCSKKKLRKWEMQWKKEETGSRDND